MLIRTATPRLIENIVIREASHLDARGVLDFARDLSRSDDQKPLQPIKPLYHNQQQEHWFIKQISDNNNALMLVAEAISTGQLIAVLTCENPPHPTKRHIVRMDMAVRHAWRGRGLSSLLVEEAIRWAKRHDEIRRIEIEVLAENANAVAMYTRLGFRVEGRAIEAVQHGGTFYDTYWMACSTAT